MKRWWIAFCVALMACIPVLLLRASSPTLLKDSDTAFLLMKITERDNPWSWFTGDWPLGNHFYRPISTLVFEFDHRLHPGNAAGFGLTNAILCCLCILATFWFVTELRANPWQGAAASVLFTLWSLGYGGVPAYWLGLVLSLVLFVALILRPQRWKELILAWLGGGYIIFELSGAAGNAGARSIVGDTLLWIPGRTATTMTLFCLISLAAFVRFERLGAERRPITVFTPLDLPATRTSEGNREPKPSWGWLGLSLVAAALALASYEQAVMLPAIIFMVAFALKLQRYEVRWWVQTGFWGLLVGYLAIRAQIVPIAPSGYQKQQLRMGPGVLMSALDYVFPTLTLLRDIYATLSTGLVLLLVNAQPIMQLKAFIGNVTAWILLKKSWLWPVFGVAVSFTAYLPMAFLHQFGHYHFWPMAMRTVAILGMLEGLWLIVINAVSLPAIQAPERSDRAPGSLPHL